MVISQFAMEAMAHRNSWFTYNSMVIFHGKLLVIVIVNQLIGKPVVIIFHGDFPWQSVDFPPLNNQ
jgi:hypothetical protein